MTHRLIVIPMVLFLAAALETGCATKKYVRNRVAERVQPLENRTTELEETSRRNSQQIGELTSGLADVRTRAGHAQETADSAAASAEQANTRIGGVETGLEDLRANLDKYSLQNTSMVFFRPGSARLTPEARAQLDQLAAQITDKSGFILEITGYGDTSGATRYNESLAQMRAQAVERYLADKDNIPVMRMFALGFGSTRPLTQNVSTNEAMPAGRAMGRRVEIRLLTHNVSGRSTRSTGTTGRVNSKPGQ